MTTKLFALGDIHGHRRVYLAGIVVAQAGPRHYPDAATVMRVMEEARDAAQSHA